MGKYHNHTEEEIREACATSVSYRQALLKLGYNANGSGSYETIKKYIRENNIDVSHFLGRAATKGTVGKTKGRSKYTAEELLIENCLVARNTVRKFLLNNNIIEYRCAICGCNGNWQGHKLSLELDHINGINNDNRIENLRFLCPNCHAITETYGSKNGASSKNEEKDKTETAVPQSNYCQNCGIKIKKTSTYCEKCYHLLQRVVERPDRETLKQEIYSNSFLQLSKKYKVSDNAIRKWCIYYNLPYKKSDIIKYDKEEWDKL